jgi:hypothetical protein
MKVTLRKFFALIALSALALAGAPFISPSVAVPAAATRDFSACVQNKQAGAVMILMDESGSVYGTKEKPGSDPKNYRITAAMILLDKLQQVSDAFNAPISIMLAGLGDDFKVRSSGSNGWLSLEPGKDNRASLANQVGTWKSKPADKNSTETDLYSSLQGAQLAFASQTDCKMLVLFKDGKDFQFFNKEVKTPVSDPEIQALLDAGNAPEASKKAADEICREAGTADGFRDSEIYLLAVALGSGSVNNEFERVKNVVEGGGGCGNEPGYGKLLLSSDPAELPQLFNKSLDPGWEPSTRQNSFTFNMTNALSGISILTSGELGAFDEYTIEPPKTCLGGKQQFKRNGETQGSFGSGVEWVSQWYSTETFKIIVNKTDGETKNNCWTGTWNVKPTGSGGGSSSSVIEFDANLQALASFGEEDFYLIPNGESKDFALSLSKVSPRSDVDLATLDKSLSFSISGQLEDVKGNVIQTVFSGVSRDAIAAAQSLNPANLQVGDYRLVMTLNTAVEGLGVALRPVRTEQIVEVRNKNRTPKVSQVVAFGDIDGKRTVEREVTFQGSPDAEFTLDFSPSSSVVKAVQYPEGLSYKFANSSENLSVKIPKGNSETKVLIAIQVAGDGPVNKRGPVSGDLEILATPVGSESNAESLKIPFTANQTPESNPVLQWVFIAVFTILALLITAGALMFVGWLVARFPKPQAAINQGLESIEIPGHIKDNQFVPSGSNISERVNNTNNWTAVGIASNRRTAQLSGRTFVSKAPGLNLGSTGHAILSAEEGNYAGWSTGDVEVDTKKSLTPRIPLHLQNSAVVLIGSQHLESNSNSPNGIPATVLLIFGTKPGSSDFGDATAVVADAERQQLLASMQYSIPAQLERLRSITEQPGANFEEAKSASRPNPISRLLSKRKETKSDPDDLGF